MSRWLPIAVSESDSKYDGPFSTYTEWHAALLGAGLGFAFLLAVAYDGSAAVAMGAVVARTVHFAHTGRTVTVAGREIELPAKYLRQIKREPHYLDGGILLGVGGAFVLLWETSLLNVAARCG
jgi:hypothetical protein